MHAVASDKFENTSHWSWQSLCGFESFPWDLETSMAGFESERGTWKEEKEGQMKRLTSMCKASVWKPPGLHARI